MKQAFLVDDSKSARIVLSRMLKKSGFDEVEMAESGEEALQQLKQVTPDAIFVDFLMDGMDGLETITEIKKDPRFATTPVVMCTANEGDEYVRAAVDHGALGILAKPPTHESLGQIISMIEQHQREVKASSTSSSGAAEAKEAHTSSRTQVESSAGQTLSLAADDVRRIAKEVMAQQLEAKVEEAAGRAVSSQLASAVKGYLDQELEPLVKRIVAVQLRSFEAPEVDTEALQDEVITRINSQLEEFVRQLNQRTVEGLIEAAIHEQSSEVADDFSQRLRDTEHRILTQVPDKNEMIDHIRVITEGSIEAQVQETARQVAHEVSNSVATETVETLLEQQMRQQSLGSQSGGKKGLIWLMGLIVAAVAGAGVYFYLF